VADVRQRYSLATGGGESKPASGSGSHPAYKKGGAVGGTKGVPPTKGNPTGFKPTKKGC
jgi:hypothetical protein